MNSANAVLLVALCLTIATIPVYLRIGRVHQRYVTADSQDRQDPAVYPAQFRIQKDFATLIVRIITSGKSGNFAVVQYGTSFREISPLVPVTNPR